MSKKESSIRVISGKFRSRKIVFPSDLSIRPTGARIRESLFNWLQADIVGANCLDLFAGSGALGIESLSRGAKGVTFVEADPKAALALTGNLEDLGGPNAVVHPINAISWLGEYKSTEQFDIVYLDPSFEQNILSKCYILLEEANILKDSCIIYIESGKAVEKTNVPANWLLQRSEKVGAVYFYLYHRIFDLNKDK